MITTQLCYWLHFSEPEESWDQEGEDDKAEEDQQGADEEEEVEEEEDEEPIVIPKKKPAESAVKVRKDHINVVFIGHVGEFCW